jgi:hypothetical protein
MGCSGQENRDNIFCIAAILNLRKACFMLRMAKRHPVRNSQFMKAIRNAQSAFKEESFKIINTRFPTGWYLSTNFGSPNLHKHYHHHLHIPSRI